MSHTQQPTLLLEHQGYSIRESKRAKKLQLSVSPLGNVEVVVPLGMDHGRIPVFVAQHKAWINQSLKRIRHHRSSMLDAVLPERIVFQATEQQWLVNYQMGANNVSRELANEKADGIGGNDATGRYLLQLTSKAEIDVFPLLSEWLTNKARQILIPWMHDISRETALPFRSVTIRAQKTRWGSCSSTKSINLNRALLFLNPRMVRYVLVHELCHTRHLNHSANYWSLVQRYEPDYRVLDAALNKATYSIPRWAYPA